MSGYVLYESVFIRYCLLSSLPGLALLSHFQPYLTFTAFIIPPFVLPQHSKLDAPLKVDCIVLLCCYYMIMGPLPLR